MKELMRTNNMVTISFVEALLRDANIDHMVLDENMSILEGSLGVLPRRILVDGDRLEEAKSLMAHAGIADELSNKR
ncbi:DUF2007 domain-containing protein [Acuticoccus kandeliae]|uniref:putative signal transducing protein n=1 Tax=Acuticoccus kandeliae TaxID=2073160 RepID=UPI000D3EB60E|nr:DUF2007 domain-containing protein [Acuticoccus kandeliae]